MESQNKTMSDSILNEYKSRVEKRKDAVLFAVCKGKFSEGLDLSDNYVRMLIVIGLPFPYRFSPEIHLKYNHLNNLSENSDEKQMMCGDDWYHYQF